MTWRADRTWDRACCLAKLPSRLRRILASEGRLGFTLLCPLILLFTADESLSDWTPAVYNTKTVTHDSNSLCNCADIRVATAGFSFYIADYMSEKDSAIIVLQVAQVGQCTTGPIYIKLMVHSNRLHSVQNHTKPMQRHGYAKFAQVEIFQLS